MFGHNAWANQTMADFIAQLPPQQRALGVPGTFGTVEHTMSHLLNAESSYLAALGAGPFWERPGDDRSPGVEELRRRAAALGEAWEERLSAGIEFDREIVRGRFTTNARQVLAQAIHHGNEHRGHICTILGANGLPWPEVSAWAWKPS